MKIAIRAAKSMQEVVNAYAVAANIFLHKKNSQSRGMKAHILKIDKVKYPADVIVALDNGKIIGMLRITERKNYFFGTLLRSAGITSVCVLPKYRGRGIGSALINMALRQIKEDDFSLSVVIARRAADGFYAQYGYVGTGIFTDFVITQKVWTHVIRHYKVRFSTGFNNGFLKNYAQMYAGTYHGLPVTFYRPVEWWNNVKAIAKYKIKSSEFVNVMYKDRIIGYFVCRGNKLIEAAGFPATGDILCGAILQFFDGKLKNGFPGASFALPRGHFCFNYYRMLNHILTARVVWDGGHLVRIIDKEKIKKAILKYINKSCSEFSRAQRSRSVDRIKMIFQKYDPAIHKEAAMLILSLFQDNSLIIKKIAKNMQHTWPALDEF